MAQAPDVLHYSFQLGLSDSSDVIQGEALLRIAMPRPLPSVALDLQGPLPGGKGMTVSSVMDGNIPAAFKQEGQRLLVTLPLSEAPERVLRIRYAGIPADGLIISPDGRGGKTFFGDNWPDRARHYLPCVDHPADKATVEWTVLAPARYQVVANGVQVEESNLPRGMKRTVYRAKEPLPTKVMVVGVGEFAVGHSGEVDGVPVSAWVFPEAREAGFREYGQAVKVLDWFTDLVAPYPFQKLANVQSRTRFGGMENAGCIFYHEHSATGDGSSEALIAHEIAHQWYGNTATELNFGHLWLSEGFATYLTHMYIESKDPAQARERLAQDRAKIIGWGPTWKRPVVDTAATDLLGLLNANSYEKGSWVLHMLRHKVGDAKFRELLRAYYDAYKWGNASTDDFRKVAERVSGQDLAAFFRQWLRTPGHPKLEIAWAWKKGNVELQVRQLQPVLFKFPLELGLERADGGVETQVVEVSQAAQTFLLPCAAAPRALQPDPGVKLLFEWKAK